jgi:hypothetical protein
MVKSLRVQCAFFLLFAFLSAFAVNAAEKKVVINEMMYHPPNDLEELEYVELYNPGDAPVDLSGWSLPEGFATHSPMAQPFNPTATLLSVEIFLCFLRLMGKTSMHLETSRGSFLTAESRLNFRTGMAKRWTA